MSLTATKEFMDEVLSLMLEEGETLYAPVYGTIQRIGKDRGNFFGFLGLADKTLLFAALHPYDASQTLYSVRIPLDIKTFRLKKALFTRQTLIRIQLTNGDDVHIRLSRKLLGGNFTEQAQNVDAFIAQISSYAN